MKVPSVLVSGRRVRIEMLPLIDIVFLLLVFFIYAMLSMAVHRGLPVALPTSTAALVEHRDMVALTLRADGRLFLDRRQVGLEELPRVLAGRGTDNGNAPDMPGVRLFGHRELSFQQLYRVLDRLREAGVTRISLQADKEERP